MAGMWSPVGAPPIIGVRVPPRDAINALAENDRVIANLVDVLVVDEPSAGADPLSHDAACDWMRPRVRSDPVFHRRLRRRFCDLGDPFWIDDRDVDVAEHVVVEQITESGWGQIERHISRVLATPMRLDRSCWEVHFLTGVRGIEAIPDGATIVVVLVHHSSMDGLGLVSVVRGLFGPHDPAAPNGPVRERRGDAMPTAMPPLRREVAAAMPRTVSFVRTLIATSRAAATRAHPHRPATRFNGHISMEHRIRVLFLDLARLRAIKNAAPWATVNDILLTAVSLALSRYLDEMDEAPAATLSATMPLDLSPAMPAPEHRAPPVAANRTTFVDVDLHTCEDDALSRLRAVHESASDAKRFARDVIAPRAAGPFDVAPAALLRVIGTVSALMSRRRRTTASGTVSSNTVVSNMPHGDATLTFRGSPVVSAFMPMPTVDGVGLIHHIASLGTNVAVTVTVDRTMMDDPDRYVQLLEGAVSTLENAATQRVTDTATS
ncbi:MAG: wax ester/triacylglycerol synthase domain-containing protein [Rhodococcus sp. (in: high G+C Gram-positive bacteria)]